METTDQFNLDQAVGHWKASLSETGDFSTEDVQELSSHLLDQIEGLSENGLTTEECFLVAKHRIGSNKLLTKAYAQSRPQTFYKLSIIFQAVVYFLIFRMLSKVASALSFTILESFNRVEQIAYLVVSAVLQVLVIFVVYKIYRHIERIRVNSRLSKANSSILAYLISITGLYIIGMAFANFETLLRFPIIPSFSSYFSIFVLFLVFLVMNIKESKRERMLAGQ